MPLPKSRTALFFFVLLSACTNHGISPPDTLSVELEAPTQTLNPLFATDTNSQHINELTHASLTVNSKDLDPIPYLAEEFRYEGKNAIYFKLRKGCQFHNGRAITADDVEKSIAFVLNPKNQSTYAETNFKNIKKFEKIDDYQFRLITDRPSPALASDLALLQVLQLDGIEAGAKPTHIPGAGPYKLVSFTSSEIRLERANQPCLPIPAIPKITIKVVRDDISRFFKLKRGELDLILNDMNYRKVEAITRNPSLPMAAVIVPSIAYQYMGVNVTAPNLRDKRVRQALTLAFDVPTLIQYKSRGMAIPARNVLADANYYANKNVPVVKRDLEKARRLLDEAGYFNGSNGKPPLHLTLKTSTGVSAVENARVLAAQAKEVGIHLEHKPYDWGIFYADVKSSNVELYMLRWTGLTDPRIYFEAFHSGEIGRNNRSKYKNPEVDRLIDAGENTLDRKERKKYYDRVQEIIAEDVPMISLWYPMNFAVYRKEVKNVTTWPNGSWRVILDMKKEVP